ncbi:integrase core domain-containing protein [Rhizorhabdus argentea]|uniref:integrase core domain-containing protein n=1 Tax=Rhizorhabdus argentea TaxID=1387174 RepID=UPI003BF5F0D9
MTCHKRLRDECLSAILFTSLAHARYELASWQHDYNMIWPHSKLGGRTTGLSFPTPRCDLAVCLACPSH